MSGFSPLHRRLLAPLAWTNAGLHVAGLVCAAVWMAPGTPLVPLADRRAYLAGPGGLAWGLSWAVWMACGLAFLAFAATVIECLGSRAGAAMRLAWGLVCVAVAADLGSDALLATWLVELARGPASDESFRLAERALGVTGAVVANGHYSLAVAVMSASLAVSGLASRMTVAAGAITVAGGALMVAAGVLDSAAWMRNSTPIAIGGFSAWSVLVARDARRWS